jgi:hypothetical protein
LVTGLTYRPTPLSALGEEGNPMVKMSIRKAGTIRLTSACYYGSCHIFAL